MRDLAFAGLLVSLLAIAAARPFVGVLLWSWISFMSPHREVFGFAQTMPWAMMTFLVTVFGCIIAREPRKPAINGVTVLLLVFAVLITLTSLTGIGPPEPRWYMYDRVIKILAGLLLTASLLTDRRRIDALVWLMVIALGYYGVKGGLFTLATGGKYIVMGPLDSMIEDRNHLAVGLLVILPIMNYLRMHARHRIVRQGLVFAMVTTLLSVVGSQSRGALLGLIATAGVFWLRSRGKVVSGIAVVIGLAVAIAFMPDSWVERMQTIKSYDEDESAMGRITMWIAAFDFARMRPLVGGGFRAIYDQGIVNLVSPGTFARATHSIWLEVMADHGFPTFFVWLGVIGYGMWYTRRIARLAKGREDLRWAFDLARMTQVATVAYMAGGSFLSLSYWDFFWTLMVVTGAVHALVLQAVRQPAPGTVAGAVPGALPAWRAQPAGAQQPAGARAAAGLGAATNRA